MRGLSAIKPAKVAPILERNQKTQRYSLDFKRAAVRLKPAARHRGPSRRERSRYSSVHVVAVVDGGAGLRFAGHRRSHRPLCLPADTREGGTFPVSDSGDSALGSQTGPRPESAKRDQGPEPHHVQEQAVGERRLPREPEGRERLRSGSSVRTRVRQPPQPRTRARPATADPCSARCPPAARVDGTRWIPGARRSAYRPS